MPKYLLFLSFFVVFFNHSNFQFHFELHGHVLCLNFFIPSFLHNFNITFAQGISVVWNLVVHQMADALSEKDEFDWFFVSSVFLFMRSMSIHETLMETCNIFSLSICCYIVKLFKCEFTSNQDS